VPLVADRLVAPGESLRDSGVAGEVRSAAAPVGCGGVAGRVPVTVPAAEPEAFAFGRDGVVLGDDSGVLRLLPGVGSGVAGLGGVEGRSGLLGRVGDGTVGRVGAGTVGRVGTGRVGAGAVAPGCGLSSEVGAEAAATEAGPAAGTLPGSVCGCCAEALAGAGLRLSVESEVAG
jgi:hypothetical protein